MNRKIIVSISIIVFLLLVYLFSLRKDRPAEFPEIKKYDNNADEIIINKKDQSIRIYKKDGKWAINDEAYPAEDTLVNNLETKMKELAITDLTTNKPYYEKYNLTPDTAITVIVKIGGKTVREILVGKKSESTNHSFVRLAGRPEVYEVSGALANDFNKTVDDLRTKEIANLPKGDFESAVINCKGRKTTLVKDKDAKSEDDEPVNAENDEKIINKKDAKKKSKSDSPKKIGVWHCAENRNIKIDEKKLSFFFDMFTPLRAKGYPQIDKKSLKNPSCTITIKYQGKTSDLKLFKIDKDTYYCLFSESQFVFSMDKHNAEKYSKTVEDFK